MAYGNGITPIVEPLLPLVIGRPVRIPALSGCQKRTRDGQNQQRWGQAAGATSATSCHVQKAALRAVRYWLALR